MLFHGVTDSGIVSRCDGQWCCSAVCRVMGSGVVSQCDRQWCCFTV